jgi:hypothetical protein
MNIEQNESGAWVISSVVGDQLTERVYMGYTEQEAKEKFMVDVMGETQEFIEFQRMVRNEGGYTVSQATLRSIDLIEAYMSLIETVRPATAQGIREEYAAVFAYMDEHDDDFWQADEGLLDEVSWLLNEVLWDEMNEISPEPYFFSSHPGDGALIGFWLDERIQQAEYEIDEGSFTRDQMIDLLHDAGTEFEPDDLDDDEIAELLKKACYDDYDFAEQVYMES